MSGAADGTSPPGALDKRIDFYPTHEHGGYPLLEHLRLILGGPALWAPSVDGAIVLSQRGGDYDLVVGQDVAIGYLEHDATDVQLYLEESFTFRVLSPEAAVALRYRD